MDIRLEALDGTDGFIIRAPFPDYQLGWSVGGGGDVDGDGFDDIVVGAPGGAGQGNGAGSAYVVLGGADHASVLVVEEDPAPYGARVLGASAGGGGDRLGEGVDIAPDTNGDGLADVILGAPAFERQVGTAATGAGVVVFGAGDLSGVLSMADLPSEDGRLLDGFIDRTAAGTSVADAGDIDGDGLADILVGGPTYSVFDGSAFVVRGGGPLSVALPTMDGESGYAILRDNDLAEFLGESVSGAGDLNGDGYGDIVIGGRAGGASFEARGRAHVLFGSAEGFDALDLRDATPGRIDLDLVMPGDGFLIDGAAPFDEAGRSVSAAGDVDGDGHDDLLIGASLADRPAALGAEADVGAAYLVFGDAQLAGRGPLDLAEPGDRVVAIRGEYRGGQAGWAVSDAGDFNGDGYDDILVGARLASDPQLAQDPLGGITYLLWGGPDFGAGGEIDLADLDPAVGIRLLGHGGYQSGFALGPAGDMNGDGFDDIVIGAPGDTALDHTGEAYVVYGFYEPPGPPARPEGVLRGTVRDDPILIGQNVTYLGLAGADTYVVSRAVAPGGTSVIEDDADTTIQFVEGLRILASLVTGTAVQIDLAGNARIQILNADRMIFEPGGNVSTGARGPRLDYDAFVEDVLGLEVPVGDDRVEGGPVTVSAALSALSVEGEPDGSLMAASPDLFDVL